MNCLLCNQPIDGDATLCAPCAEEARAEIAATRLAAPYTGDVCHCGALLTVMDRAGSRPGSCAKCREEETMEWLKAHGYQNFFAQNTPQVKP